MTDLFGNCDLCGRPLGGFSAEFLPLLAYKIDLIGGATVNVCWFCVFDEQHMNHSDTAPQPSARFIPAIEEEA